MIKEANKLARGDIVVAGIYGDGEQIAGPFLDIQEGVLVATPDTSDPRGYVIVALGKNGAQIGKLDYIIEDPSGNDGELFKQYVNFVRGKGYDNVLHKDMRLSTNDDFNPEAEQTAGPRKVDRDYTIGGW